MPPSAVAATGPTLLARPASQLALSIVGSVCGTLVSGAMGSSPTGQLFGAALGASIPTLISVVGPGHGLRAGAGIVVTAIALLVTYGGATAHDFATDSPATFPMLPGVSEPDTPSVQGAGHDDPGPPDSVTQHDPQGRGIRVTPAALACTPDGCSSPVELQSVGKAPFKVTSLELAGDVFQAGEDCVGRELAPGDHCSFEVRYSPDGEPHEAKLIIHQTLSGDPTTVQLRGTGEGPAPTVDLPAPDVLSCVFAQSGSGGLEARLQASLAAAGDDAPDTVALSAGLAGEDPVTGDAIPGGGAVDLVVPIPEEQVAAGLAITVQTDPAHEVPESDDDNNVRTVTAGSVPVEGAPCGT